MNVRRVKKNLSTQVKEILLKGIIEGHFPEGTPLPTEEQLGKNWGLAELLSVML